MSVILFFLVIYPAITEILGISHWNDEGSIRWMMFWGGGLIFYFVIGARQALMGQSRG